MNNLRQQQTSLVEFLRQHVRAYRALPKTLKQNYIRTKMIPELHGRWYTYTKERGFEVPGDEELAMKLREKMRPLQPLNNDDSTRKRASQRGPSPNDVMQHDDSILWNEGMYRTNNKERLLAGLTTRLLQKRQIPCNHPKL